MVFMHTCMLMTCIMTVAIPTWNGMVIQFDNIFWECLKGASRAESLADSCGGYRYQ